MSLSSSMIAYLSTSGCSCSHRSISSPRGRFGSNGVRSMSPTTRFACIVFSQSESRLHVDESTTFALVTRTSSAKRCASFGSMPINPRSHIREHDHRWNGNSMDGRSHPTQFDFCSRQIWDERPDPYRRPGGFIYREKDRTKQRRFCILLPVSHSNKSTSWP